MGRWVERWRAEIERAVEKLEVSALSQELDITP